MNLGQYGHRPGIIRPPSFGPGGYLTPVSGQPVITANATGVATLFYTPDCHNTLPVLRAGVFDALPFGEVEVPLAGLSANSIYDLMAYWDGRNVKIGWSPAWQVAAVASGDRGVGLGTPELMRCDGLMVNKNPIVISINGESRAIGAGAGTYLASVMTDGVAGQTTCHRSAGQSRKWGVWNAYNRRSIILSVSDPSTFWSYAGALRASRNDSANCMFTFTGLPEGSLDFRCSQTVLGFATNNQQFSPAIGIGFNSTTAASGKSGGGSMQAAGGDGTSISWSLDLDGSYSAPPSLGANRITFLESNLPSTPPAQFWGAGRMLMTGEFRG
ncbi:hypothetical protein [Afipia carboxidovorans]|uniref:hypothetical protein n=1 Tax=Afipia carboxidovorans TaxID=40137 RepID=UPI00308844B8|nr:hypothetical protein CRBSH125_06110 [Afipia carboxidovorans]